MFWRFRFLYNPVWSFFASCLFLYSCQFFKLFYSSEGKAKGGWTEEKYLRFAFAFTSSSFYCFWLVFSFLFFCSMCNRDGYNLSFIALNSPFFSSLFFQRKKMYVCGYNWFTTTLFNYLVKQQYMCGHIRCPHKVNGVVIEELLKSTGRL